MKGNEDDENENECKSRQRPLGQLRTVGTTQTKSQKGDKANEDQDERESRQRRLGQLTN